MSTGKLTVWCDACDQETIAKENGECVWCDGPTRRKRRGGRPKGKYRRISDEQLRAAHRLYVVRKLSCRQLGELLYERLGYTSARSCGEALYNGFKSLGLPRRSQREVTIARNLKHGRKRRSNTPDQDRAYREWRRDQNGWRSVQGPGQATCQSVKRNPPGKGDPCGRPSMEGSDYCVSHDPKLDLERQAQLARMRARLARHETLPLEPFAAWVELEHRRLGSYAAVAEMLGCSTSTAANIILRRRTQNGALRQPWTTITRPALDRYLSRPGVPTFAELYGAGRDVIAA